jgi:hypothetical protein
VFAGHSTLEEYMIRVRIVSVAIATCLAFGAAAVPAAAASNGTGSQTAGYNLPALYTVALKGTTKNKPFNGKFKIERFIAKGNKAYALGTVTGTFAGHRFTRTNVTTPASLTGEPSGTTSRAHAAAACDLLHLVIQPIHLSLLGLDLTLGGGTAMDQPIVVDLTANSGQGLLGDLLCDVDNALNQNGALSSLTGGGLATVLNSVVGYLEGILSGL